MTSDERFDPRLRRDDSNPPPFRPNEAKGPSPTTRLAPPPRPAAPLERGGRSPASRPAPLLQKPGSGPTQPPFAQTQQPARGGAYPPPPPARPQKPSVPPRTQTGAPRPLQPGERHPSQPYGRPAMSASPYAPASGSSMGPAEAARRAAEASFRLSEGKNPPAYPERESDELPERNRFADEFFTGDDDDVMHSERSHRGLIIGISLTAALLLLFSLFFLFSRFSRSRDVRMAKQTTTAGTMRPTTARTTPEATTRKTTEQTTLTPPGTDPYDNVPAWTPPTAAATLPPEQVAPPPVVQQVTTEPTLPLPSPESSLVLPTPALPAPTPEIPVPETPAPEISVPEVQNPDLPASAPSLPENPIPEVTLPSESTTDLPENANLLLPALPANESAAVPAPASPDVTLPQADAALLSPEEAKLRLGEALANGFSEVYASPSGRYYFGKSQDDGFYYLLDITVGGHAVQLPMHAPEKLGQMAGDKGFGYIMDHQLYYLAYEGAAVTLVLPDVQDALLADEAACFLVKRNNGAYLAGLDGSLVELAAPGTIQGDLKLLTVSSDAKFAAFQDQSTIYIYTVKDNPPGQVLSIEGTGSGDAKVLRSSDGRQSLIYQSGSSVLVRLDGDTISQIQLSAGTLSNDALVLPAGNSATGPYGRLAIFSNNTLYVANEKISAGNGVFSAVPVASGIENVCAGGNALFYTDDQQRGLHVLDLSAVGEGLDSSLIVSGGAEDICCTADGGTVYYRQNGQLWCRRSGSPAEAVAQDCTAFLIDAAGSRIYLATSQGSLIRIQQGTATELAAPGSGVNRDSFKSNTMVQGGGNLWLGNEAFRWSVQGQSYLEP